MRSTHYGVSIVLEDAVNNLLAAEHSAEDGAPADGDGVLARAAALPQPQKHSLRPAAAGGVHRSDLAGQIAAKAEA